MTGIESTLVPPLSPRLADDLRRGRALVAERIVELDAEFARLRDAVRSDRDLGRVDVYPNVQLHRGAFGTGPRTAVPRQHRVTLSLPGFAAIGALYERVPVMPGAPIDAWRRASFRPDDPAAMWEVMSIRRGPSRLVPTLAEALALAELETTDDADTVVSGSDVENLVADRTRAALRAMHGEAEADEFRQESAREMAREAFAG